MNNKILTAPLFGLREYGEIRERMRKTTGILSLTGCVEAQKAQMIYGLSFDVPVILAVAENDLAARNLYENLRLYIPDAMLYPAKDLLFYQADVASNLLDQQRLAVMRRLIGHAAGDKSGAAGPAAVVLPVAALMDCVTERAVMEAERLTFAIGEEHDFDTVKKTLVLLGYERCGETEMPGQFAFRGDILDIWPVTEANPVRIEFFGDEIDAMRLFDAESQRSVEEIEVIEVYPANDHTGMTAPFLSWFAPEKTQVFLDEPNRLMEAAGATESEFRESIEMRLAGGMYEASSESGSGGEKPEIPEIIGARQLQASLGKMYAVSLSMLDIRREGWALAETWGTTVQAVGSYRNSFDMLVSDLKKYRRLEYRTVIVCASHTRAKRLADGLYEQGIPAFFTEDTESPLEKGQIAVICGYASRGFEYPMIRFAVISEADIFGEREARRKKRRAQYGSDGKLLGEKSDDAKAGTDADGAGTGSGTEDRTAPGAEAERRRAAKNRITSFSELRYGDYVVHENHGVGIYRGIEQIESNGALRDYIKIEYSGSNLYILATQLDALMKYAGAESAKPKLNRLGGDTWNRTRSKVRSAVRNIAKDLVALYAARREENGFVYGPDTEWQREFEEMFPYEETEDQLAAISDTKRDMESRKIMDRLICGDVGYGKTEIALRAAFKAVQENKQVAYLVPTTILAQQHFNTFAQRMKDFPVRVDMLCRFRTPAQQAKTIKDLKSGMVDIVIGTHRLLSKDVKWKDLGLLIIDEEQRFGVAHKEKIKQLRKNVDVLTLTATPIPRTLHMSLIGIRDMSVLEEPPQDRVPIQTYVMEYNEEMIREAIARELARGGQVYYVYNRVNDIAEVAGRIADLVPEAAVSFAHGQMKEAELEQIMVDFVNGGIDVLVTTTIIETGLDIANVNTMIIHDADKMGLSQLYQLRGRVGRTNRTAYAFLMYRRDRMLKEVAEKRLSAIREFTALGSGIRIAMRDLEIRGAGNLLGAEQSGHMEAVGYDLYAKMLADAVREEKGIPKEESFETVVDLSMDAFIPGKYIPNEFQKLDAYKRIAGITQPGDCDDIYDELLDRYGEPPRSVTNLIKIADLKAAAHAAYITEIKETPAQVKLLMHPDPKIDVSVIPELIRKYCGKFTIHPYANETFFLYHGDRAEEEMLSALKTFVSELVETPKKV